MPQLIPKEKPKPSPALNFLLYCAVFCLVVVLVLYFWFSSRTGAVRAEIEVVKEQQTTLKTKEIRRTEKEVVETSQRINDFSQIFKEHKLSSQFFSFLEGIVHPKVQVLTLSLMPNSLTMNISGNAQTIRAVGEQLLVLQANQLLEEITLSGPSLEEEGGVSFGLRLLLKPGVLGSFEVTE